MNTCRADYQHFTMKDLLGQELQVGDIVVYNPPVYKGIKLGVIKGFTPKGGRVSIVRVGKQWASGINEHTTVQMSRDVVKVPREQCEHVKA